MVPVSIVEPLRWRRIHADGTVDADRPIEAIGPALRLGQLTTTRDGRWLLTTDDVAAEERVLWVLQDDGAVAHERHGAPYGWLLDRDEPGQLVTTVWDHPVSAVTLFDPDTLADRARLRTGPEPGEGPQRWRILDDGSLYGIVMRPQGGGYVALARYSAPGATPSDVLFRDGMD